VARDAKVAEPFIIGTPETVRKWVRGAEVDAGARPSIATEEFAELKRLKRDNVELTQASERRLIASRPSSTGRRGHREVHQGALEPPARWWFAVGVEPISTVLSEQR
jgi:transposase-like protein